MLSNCGRARVSGDQRRKALVGPDADCVARWLLLLRQCSGCLREQASNCFGSLINGKAVCRWIG